MTENNLTQKEVEDTKKYSIIDGSAWSVMYGFGEQYITPFALRLGASNSQIGFLASIPAFIGSLFQLIGAKLTEKYQNRKKIVLVTVFLQALILLPLFIIPFITKNITLLTIFFSIYLIFANLPAPAWNSWIGDVVPQKDRNEYFSKRNRTTLTVLFLSVLIAGLILDYYSNVDIWIGFALLFTIAFVGRIVSWYMLTKQSEPTYTYNPSHHFPFKEFVVNITKTNFGNFVLFRSLMAFAIMIAAPFFAVYMLKDLQFTYTQFTAIVLVPMIVKAVTMTYWGKNSKTFGTKNIMFISAFLIATLPLAWFVAGYFFYGSGTIFYIIIFAEIVAGFAWAGFDLTTFNYVLETLDSQKRPRGVAYFNVIMGLAVLIGGITGSILVDLIPSVGSMILFVFLISAVLRFIIPIIFYNKVHEVQIKEHYNGNKLFLELVVVRPFGAAMHQTTHALMFAEKGVELVGQKTLNGIKKISEPIEPILEEIVDKLDEGLEKIEPLRKNLEPQRIKKNKKRAYKHLTTHNYKEYIKTHPKIVKKYKPLVKRKKLKN